MTKVLAVAVGGAIGAVLRFLISQWATERWGALFPLGTLIVNGIGCFLMGLVMGIITMKSGIDEHWRLLLAVGFLGGLTTFSSFGLETVKLWQQAQPIGALLNISGNVVIGLLATTVGMSLAGLFR